MAEINHPFCGTNGDQPPKDPLLNRKHTNDLAVLLLAAAIALGYTLLAGPESEAAQNLLSGVVGACLMWVKRS